MSKVSHTCEWIKQNGERCTRTCRIENDCCAKHRARPAPKKAAPCFKCGVPTKTNWDAEGRPCCARATCGVNLYRVELRRRRKAAKASDGVTAEAPAEVVEASDGVTAEVVEAPAEAVEASDGVTAEAAEASDGVTDEVTTAIKSHGTQAKLVAKMRIAFEADTDRITKHRKIINHLEALQVSRMDILRQMAGID
jgi:hypothetical protein